MSFSLLIIFNNGTAAVIPGFETPELCHDAITQIKKEMGPFSVSVAICVKTKDEK